MIDMATWRREQRKGSPTLYLELEKALQKHGSSWGDIEAITIGGYEDKNIVLGRKEAEKIFKKCKLVDSHGADLPDNLYFYAYTKDRIFFITASDEQAIYGIDSLPRNPTNKETPRHMV